VTALGQALGDRALVEFVAFSGTLYALTIVDGTLRMIPLESVATVAGLVERLPFALHRLARWGASADSRAAAFALLRSTAQRLDTALLRPLAELADRPMVVVPTGPLHSLPWSVLPSCTGRPLTVSPSATLWQAIGDRPTPTTSAVAVAAGPGLRNAQPEARAVAAIHHTTALLDSAATVDAVLASLTTASLAHLATHGRLSRDNPLFSRLRLADGPLVVYDIERLDRVPHTVVLAACDSARSTVCTGDELLGFGATFIARGTAQLIASVVPVPDAETMTLMHAFHRQLATGQVPAAALTAAQQQLDEHDAPSFAAAAGFLCIGHGFTPPPLHTQPGAVSVRAVYP
jgi:CHAT domain-containing protein